MGQAYGCFIVRPAQVAVTEQFGKSKDILQPGCHCVPWFLGRKVAGTLCMGVQKLNVPCQAKTKDNIFVTVVASIQYQAMPKSAKDAFYSTAGCKVFMHDHVCDVILSTLAKYELAAVFEQKDEIAKVIETNVVKARAAFGYKIVGVLIVDIKPDAIVKKAMNLSNAVARMRAAAKDKEAAKKIFEIKKAEGKAEAMSKYVMEIVLMTQYVDAMKDIGALPNSTSVIIPCGVGQVNDVSDQIKNAMGPN